MSDLYNLPDVSKLEAIKLKPLFLKDQLEIMIIEAFNNVTRLAIMERIHRRGVLLTAQEGKAHEVLLQKCTTERTYFEKQLGTLLEFHAEEVAKGEIPVALAHKKDTIET